MTNQRLKQVLELQDIDRGIEALEADLESLPAQIAERRAKIQQAQDAFQQEKTKLTQIQLGRKSKEMEAAAQEEKIRKHGLELNSVKSNEAYKALLSEIDAAKNEKSRVEDGILMLMEEYDATVRSLKIAEEEAKKVQAALEAEVRAVQEKIEQAQAQLAAERKRRDDFAPQVAADVLSRYDYIRKKRKSVAIVPVAGGSCSGCNTNLTHSTMNEVKKGKELITCESCSRILFIPDPQPVAPS